VGYHSRRWGAGGMSAPSPARGEIWYVDLNPTRGHEQAGQRPALVVSADAYNRGPADMVVVIPLTTRHRGIPLHVLVEPPEGGLRQDSVIKCDYLRAVSKQRLLRRIGAVQAPIMEEVERHLRALMGL
jgi:mRNA interferase MazF